MRSHPSPWAAALAVSFAASAAFGQQIYSIEVQATGATQTVTIDWQSNPLDEYYVKRTASLLSGGWTNATPQALAATNLTMRFTQPAAERTQFFTVERRDMAGPEFSLLFPRPDAVAVPRDAAISVSVNDASTIDTNSVVFTLSGTNHNLASPWLSLDGQTLQYTNAVPLGGYGETVTVSVAAADIHGNIATGGVWSCRLELDTVVQSNVLVVGAAGGGQSVGGYRTQEAGLELIGTYSNRLVFSYSGSHGLFVGQLLASSDPENVFYRRIVSLDDHPAQGEVVAWTSDARLEEFFGQASIDAGGFVLYSPGGGGGMAAQAEVGWHLGLNPSGPLLPFELDNGDISLSGDFGSYDLSAGIGVWADIELSGVEACDIWIEGALSVELAPELIVDIAGEASGSVPLITPVHHFYGGAVGIVPVWVEVVFELEAGAVVDAHATGSITGGVRVDRAMRYNISLRDNQWTNWMDDSGWVWEPVPFEYTLEGDATARVYVQPRVTVYVYSLVGAYAALEPYLEFHATYEVLPSLSYTYEMLAGLDFKLGLAVRFWNDEWGELPYWTLPVLSNQIWFAEYPQGAPRIVTPPKDVVCQEGQTATFTVEVESDPPASFLWYQNGDDIGWALSPSLSFTATAANQGDYTVVVSNANGSTNATAHLTVVTGPAPSGMVLIPGGSNSGTNPLGAGESYDSCYYPQTYSLTVDPFYMHRYEVTNDEMAQVLNWAYGQGKLDMSNPNSVRNAEGSGQELLDLDDSHCRITWNGSSFGMKSTKGSGYPCVEVTWYGAAAYCNYRTEMEGEGRTPCYVVGDWTCNFSADGYRLPTDEEWEYAARGGAAGKRFPWGGNTISHSEANYYADGYSDYDVSSGAYHPAYDVGGPPFTSPVGAFDAGKNAYGLYDMAGTVREWCWDWHPCYVGSSRVVHGGGWSSLAYRCRAAFRRDRSPGDSDSDIGFRAVLPVGP